MTELAGFCLGDSLLAFPIITGAAFNHYPFSTSYSKILGVVFTVGVLNPILQRERLYSGEQKWEWPCSANLAGRSSRESEV